MSSYYVECSVKRDLHNHILHRDLKRHNANNKEIGYEQV